MQTGMVPENRTGKHENLRQAFPYTDLDVQPCQTANWLLQLNRPRHNHSPMSWDSILGIMLDHPRSPILMLRTGPTTSFRCVDCDSCSFCLAVLGSYHSFLNFCPVGSTLQSHFKRSITIMGWPIAFEVLPTNSMWMLIKTQV